MDSPHDEKLSLAKELIESDNVDFLFQNLPGKDLPNAVEIRRKYRGLWKGLKLIHKGDDCFGLCSVLRAFECLRPSFDSWKLTWVSFMDSPLHRIVIQTSQPRGGGKIPRGIVCMSDDRKRFPPLTFSLEEGHDRKQLLRTLYTILHHGGKEDRELLWGYLQAEGLGDYAGAFKKKVQASRWGQAWCASRNLDRTNRRLKWRQEANQKEATSRLSSLSLSPLKENIPDKTEDTEEQSMDDDLHMDG